MTREDAIEILIAVAVCDRPILSCDFCARYVGMGTDCTYPSDKEIEESVLFLKGASKDMAIEALRQQDVSDTDVVRWISVKDRLPERTMPPHDVLVYHDLNCGMYIDRVWYSREKNKWRNVLGMNLKVTHWMPLPEPPEELD